MMDIRKMTRKELEALPHRKWDEEIVCDSLIIIPGGARELHDSGYRLLDFVAVVKWKPICLASGCSDVIHIDGIGGYGYRWVEKRAGVPQLVPPVAWSIDCLPKSGLLRLFVDRCKIRCGSALSSFEVFAVKRKEG